LKELEDEDIEPPVSIGRDVLMFSPVSNDNIRAQGTFHIGVEQFAQDAGDLDASGRDQLSQDHEGGFVGLDSRQPGDLVELRFAVLQSLHMAAPTHIHAGERAHARQSCRFIWASSAADTISTPAEVDGSCPKLLIPSSP
jgi:hypothetical protein